MAFEPESRMPSRTQTWHSSSSCSVARCRIRTSTNEPVASQRKASSIRVPVQGPSFPVERACACGTSRHRGVGLGEPCAASAATDDDAGIRIAGPPDSRLPSRTRHAMQEKSADTHPLSDLAYDWITLIQNKAQALMAYDQYIQDAEQAKSPECAAFFRKVHDTDKAQLAEAKQHLVAVLQGKMGNG